MHSWQCCSLLQWLKFKISIVYAMHDGQDLKYPLRKEHEQSGFSKGWLGRQILKITSVENEHSRFLNHTV